MPLISRENPTTVQRRNVEIGHVFAYTENGKIGKRLYMSLGAALHPSSKVPLHFSLRIDDDNLVLSTSESGDRMVTLMGQGKIVRSSTRGSMGDFPFGYTFPGAKQTYAQNGVAMGLLQDEKSEAHVVALMMSGELSLIPRTVFDKENELVVIQNQYNVNIAHI